MCKQKLFHGAAFGILMLSQIGTSGALAQSASQCTCSTPFGAGQSQVGTVTSVNGDVRLSGTGSFGSAAPGNPLFIGSQIVSGSGSGSSILVGRCSMSVPANATLIVSKIGQNICLKVAKAAPVTPAPQVSSVAPLAIGGLVVAAGAGVAVAVSTGSKAASQ